MLKRLFDIVVSFTALLASLPLLLILAILIKLDTPGPALFRHDRVGLHKKPFKLNKFRSMIINDPRNNPQVTAVDDNRITKVGKFLRKTKLDELPQLWNVLVGDISLVGPRPEAPRYTAHYKPEWERVFEVRPGITDYATYNFHDEQSILDIVEDKEKSYIEIIMPIKMDLALKYVDDCNLWVDLKILFMTVWQITFARVFGCRDDSLMEKTRATLKEKMKINSISDS